MANKTRQQFEKVLNSKSPRHNNPQWVINGQRRTNYEDQRKYGTALRIHDNMQFEVLYKEWERR